MKKITIYTDGACSGNPGPGGYAAILIYDGTEKEISGYEEHTTNNRMELTAVIKALECLREKCEIDLFTDSTYVANAFLNGWVYGWKKKNWKADGGMRLNYDLWEKLYGLSEIHDINWNVVKGHSDNEYNNRCDKLAVSEYKNNGKTSNPVKIQDITADDTKKNNDNDILIPAAKNDSSDQLSEKVIFDRNVFEGQIFNISVMEVMCPDGKLRRREVLKHNGGCAILAVDDDGFVPLVSQYRTGAGKTLLEIPAGKIEKGENPDDCAVRELAEEVGLKASEMKKIAQCYVTPGYCTEKIHIYLAKGLSPTSANPDEDEFLNISKIHIDELAEMVRNGEIEDVKTAYAVLLYKSF